jgi:predicted kinase
MAPSHSALAAGVTGTTEMYREAKLLFLCGKMAAGKSTLSRQLAERENAVLLVQDEFLERLSHLRSKNTSTSFDMGTETNRVIAKPS